MTDKTKPVVKGKPFAPGHDERRHKGGSRSRTAAEFGQAFSKAIAEGGDAEALAQTLWTRALKGDRFATDTILERTLGRPLQQISFPEPPTAIRILYRPKTDNLVSPNDETLADGTKVEGVLYRASSEVELDQIEKRDSLLTQADIEEDKRQKRRMEFSKGKDQGDVPDLQVAVPQDVDDDGQDDGRDDGRDDGHDQDQEARLKRLLK